MGPQSKPEAPLGAGGAAGHQRRRCDPARALWALGVALLVLAGSLSPFTFDLAAARASRGVGLGAIGWPPSAYGDLITNIVVYLPVGAALFLWLRRRFRAWPALVMAGALGGVTSLLAETLQTCVPVRTASWIDVVVNAIGTLCGAAIAPAVSPMVRAATHRIREGIARRPMSTTASALAVGLLVMGICPFDFVTTTAALHTSLARSRWFPFDTALGGAGAGGLTTVGVSALGVAGVFAALGFFVALGAREAGQPRRRAGALSLVHVALLAVLIETVQIFVVSRSLDVGEVLLDICVGALGVCLAIYAVDGPSRSGWVGRPAALLHPLLVGPALILQVGYHLLHAAAPSQPSAVHSAGAVLLWVPFSAYYGPPSTSVMSHVLSVWIAFALLALTIALLTRRLGPRACWWVAAGAVLAVAACCEVIQFARAVRTPDLTDPLMALAAAILAALVYRRLQATHAPVQDGSPLDRRSRRKGARP